MTTAPFGMSQGQNFLRAKERLMVKTDKKPQANLSVALRRIQRKGAEVLASVLARVRGGKELHLPGGRTAPAVQTQLNGKTGSAGTIQPMRSENAASSG